MSLFTDKDISAINHHNLTKYFKYKRPGTKMLLGPLLWNLELEIPKSVNNLLVKIMLRLMIREVFKKEKNGIVWEFFQ